MTGVRALLEGMAGVRHDPPMKHHEDARGAWLEAVLAWAIVATVFFLPISEALKNLSYGVALACYIGTLFRMNRDGWSIPPIGVAFLLFLIVAILSAATSAFPRKAFGGVWEVFRYVSFFFIVRRGVRRSSQVVAVLWAAVAGIGVAVAVVLYRYFIAGLEYFSMLSLGSKHEAAEYVVMMLILMITMFEEYRGSGRARLLLGIVVGMNLLALGVSNVRTMWGGFIAAAILLWVWRRSWTATAAAGLLLAVVIGVGLVRPDIRQRAVELARPETYVDFNERREIWLGALQMWRDHPWLGTGPRTFKLSDDLASDPNRRQYGIPARAGQAHNMWLQVAAEMGTLGLLTLAGWMIAAAALLLRCRDRLRGWPLTAVWAGASGSLLVIVIAGVTDPAIGYEQSMLFNGLLAMAAGAGESIGRRSCGTG